MTPVTPTVVACARPWTASHPHPRTPTHPMGGPVAWRHCNGKFARFRCVKVDSRSKTKANDAVKERGPRHPAHALSGATPSQNSGDPFFKRKSPKTIVGLSVNPFRGSRGSLSHAPPRGTTALCPLCPSAHSCVEQTTRVPPAHPAAGHWQKTIRTKIFRP